MKASHSEFIQVRGKRIHVRIWGAPGAPEIYMLHGWGDVSATYQFVVDALARDWRVIAPDWRGFGLSEWNRDAYWFPEYVADLDAVLEHYSPNAPARLVGHSLGANVSCLYAGIRPERVAGLVNLEGIGLPAHAPSDAPSRYAKWLEQRRGEPAFRPYADFNEFAARLQRENPRLTMERAAFMARTLGQETADGRVVIAGDPCHRWMNPIAFRVEEAMACWQAMTAPMLLITGTESFIFREFFAADSDEYKRRLACFKQVREVSLTGCGHNLHHDEPEQVARLIEEFFA